MFIELHLATLRASVLGALSSLGYRVAATVRRTRRASYGDLLLLRKVKYPAYSPFSITYIDSGDRFRLNKYITSPRVDLVTILPSPTYPTKRQLAMIEDEGKYVELVVMPFIRRGMVRELANVASLILESVDNVVVSLGVESMSDVKNPLDVAKLLGILTGDEAYWIRAVRRNAESLVADALYRRGVCTSP